MKQISNNHQEWNVFHFSFASGETRRVVSVASTGKEEAKELILAMFDNVTTLREKRRSV